MLLSQVVLLVVILIFRLYIILAQCLNQPLIEVAKLILSSPNKFCELDAIPTFLLKSCLHTLIVIITKIINVSLSSGVSPSHFEHAHLIPLLKKPSLPANYINSYTCISISNLSFISKVLEKVVFCRLNVHLNCSHLFNVCQSLYKQFVSTENALLKVHNDISLNMDTGKVTALTLLDLSASFNTIDYSVLLGRFSDWYGISGTVGSSHS